MTAVPDPRHQQDPTDSRTLVPELADTILTVRAAAAHAHPDFLQLTVPEQQTFVCSAVLDTVIAMLIRHRLPIDADSAALVVRRNQDQDADAWARACAEHVVQIAQASR